MKINKGRAVFLFLLLLPWLGTSRLAQAIAIEFAPLNQTVSQGQLTTVDVRIIDADPGGLGAYDFSVNYDPAILVFNTAISSSFLGVSFGLLTTPSAGSVNLADFSFDLPADLLALQPNSFVLLTLAFDTIATGISPLQFGGIILGDVNGAALSPPQPFSGSIRVQQVSLVPEPVTLFLFGVGATGIILTRRRKQTN